jgi:hypothetical protein
MPQVSAPSDVDVTTQGTWERLRFDSQVLAVHAALLHSGKVLFAAGSGNNAVRSRSNDFGDTDKGNWVTVVWDPSVTPSETDSNFFHPDTLRARGKPIDFFCGGESFLADGNLLAAGGTEDYVNGGFLGRRTAVAFNPNTQQWTPRNDLTVGRWYPTLLALGDGRILAVAGLDHEGKIDSQEAKTLEVYSPKTNDWQNLGIPVGLEHRLPLYAHLFLIEDGRVFFSGGRMDDGVDQDPVILDLARTPVTATPVPGLNIPGRRNQSASVLLPPAQDQRVMVIGGGPHSHRPGETEDPEAISDVSVVDLKDAQPHYREAAPMHLSRVHLNAVLLPDRTVFVSGGASRHEDTDIGTIPGHEPFAQRQAEIYDPATNTWRLVASASVARMYHSVALLLPDGRVVTAGNNPSMSHQVGWNQDSDHEEMALEVYYPPYLFRGGRPVIRNVSTEWRYGEGVEVESPQAQSIKWASLIRSGVTTHSFDNSQRLVDLPIEGRDDDGLSLRVPDNPNVAPPGWYMLFLTDHMGVPSKAQWIHLESKESVVSLGTGPGETGVGL